MRGDHHLVVRLRAVDGRADELRAELVELAEASRATLGCTGFVVSRSVESESEFWLFESFDSPEAYAAHVAAPHAQRFLTVTLPGLVAERQTLTVTPTRAAP